MPTIDLFDDAVGVGGPDERFGFAIVLAEIAVDRRLQVDERAEDAALQAPPGQRREKAFDGIGPRARGRREMKRPARMAGEPGADFGMLDCTDPANMESYYYAAPLEANGLG